MLLNLLIVIINNLLFTKQSTYMSLSHHICLSRSIALILLYGKETEAGEVKELAPSRRASPNINSKVHGVSDAAPGTIDAW